METGMGEVDVMAASGGKYNVKILKRLILMLSPKKWE